MAAGIDDCLDVAKLIQKSDSSMTYSWYKSKDGLKHTGIILEFDGSQVLALDFGANLPTFKVVVKSSSALSLSSFSPNEAKNKLARMKLAGKVNLSSYNGHGKIRIGTLLDLDLSGPEKKNEALDIFKSVEKVGQEMKEYQLMENNCRDYVIAVAKMLENQIKERNPVNWSNFEFEMQKLKSNDQQKYDEVKKAIDVVIQLHDHCFKNSTPPYEPPVDTNVEGQNIQ